MLKRWSWIIILVVIVLAGAFFFLRPQPIVMEIATISRGPLRVTVEEEGRTRIRDRFVVSSPVPGYLRRIHWKAGHVAKAGEVAAVIEPPRADVLDTRTRQMNEARLRVAEAAVKSSETRRQVSEDQARAAAAESEFWTQQFQREQGLVKSGDIPEERLAKTRTEAQRTEASRKAAESGVANARAEQERARAEVETARAALTPSISQKKPGELVYLRWPVSGRVLKVIKDDESVVQAGEQLIELGNTRALEVEVEVLSLDAVKMSPGTPVEFHRWGGDQPLEGRVRLVEPSGFTKVSALGVEEQRVRVIADITSPEQQWLRLGDGYRVEAVFVLWQAGGVLQVPASALFRKGDQWAVFVVENSIARRREVQIGHRSGLAAEIVSGLKEGEKIISHPDETVDDGKLIEPKNGK